MTRLAAIEVGQIWRDKDRRREAAGTVRTFKVVHITSFYIECERIDDGSRKSYAFLETRFGSNAANDSFVLESAPAKEGEIC